MKFRVYWRLLCQRLNQPCRIALLSFGVLAASSTNALALSVDDIEGLWFVTIEQHQSPGGPVEAKSYFRTFHRIQFRDHPSGVEFDTDVRFLVEYFFKTKLTGLTLTGSGFFPPAPKSWPQPVQDELNPLFKDRKLAPSFQATVSPDGQTISGELENYWIWWGPEGKLERVQKYKVPLRAEKIELAVSFVRRTPQGVTPVTQARYEEPFFVHAKSKRDILQGRMGSNSAFTIYIFLPHGNDLIRAVPMEETAPGVYEGGEIRFAKPEAPEEANKSVFTPLAIGKWVVRVPAGETLLVGFGPKAHAQIVLVDSDDKRAEVRGTPAVSQPLKLCFSGHEVPIAAPSEAAQESGTLAHPTTSANADLLDGRFVAELAGQKVFDADILVQDQQIRATITHLLSGKSCHFRGARQSAPIEVLSDVVPSRDVTALNAPEVSEEDKASLESVELRESLEIREMQDDGFVGVFFFPNLIRDSSGRAVDIDDKARASHPVFFTRVTEKPLSWPQSCREINFTAEKIDTTLYARQRFSRHPVRIPGVQFALYPAEHDDLPIELVQEIHAYNQGQLDEADKIQRIYVGQGGVLTVAQHQATVARINTAQKVSQDRCLKGLTYFETLDEYALGAAGLEAENERRRTVGKEELDEAAGDWVDQAKVRTVEFRVGLKSFVIAQVIEDGTTKYLLSTRSQVFTAPSGKPQSQWDLSEASAQEIRGTEEWRALGDLAIIFSGPHEIFTRPFVGGESVGQRWIKSIFDGLKSQGLHHKVFVANPAALHALANMAGALRDTVPQVRDDLNDIAEDWQEVRDPHASGTQKLAALGLLLVTGVTVVADAITPIPALRNARAALKQTRSAHKLARMRVQELDNLRTALGHQERSAEELAQLDQLIERQRKVAHELGELETKAVEGLDELQRARYDYAANPAYPSASRPEYAGKSVEDLQKLRENASPETKRRITEELGERAVRQAMTRRSGAERQIITESGGHRHGPDQYYVERRQANGQSHRVHLVVESKGGDFGGVVPTEDFANSLLDVRVRSQAKQNFPEDVAKWSQLRMARDLNKKANIHQELDTLQRAQARAVKTKDANRVASLQQEIDALRARDAEIDRQIGYWDEIRGSIANPSVVELRLFVTDVTTRKFYGFRYDPIQKKYVRAAELDGELPLRAS